MPSKPIKREDIDAFKKRKASSDNRRRLLASKYSMTVKDYDKMLSGQYGVCAICGTRPSGSRPLSVDHDHQTGMIRGLLCTSCNMGLGHFRDSPRLLARALVYLEDCGNDYT